MTLQKPTTDRRFNWFCIPCGEWQEHLDPSAFAFSAAICPKCKFKIDRDSGYYVETEKAPTS
jgi:hypothetical protein